MSTDTRIIKTYVWHEEQCFFVSTIERDSSAMLGPRRYNETLVWCYDWEARKQGALLYQESAPRGSIVKHQTMVEELFATGKCEEI